MSDKKVKVQWSINIKDLPEIMKELFFRALNQFNFHDMTKNIETAIKQDHIQAQLNSIDTLRREMMLFDERLSDIYYQLFGYQSEMLEEKRKEMLSNQTLKEDLNSRK